MFRKSVIVAVLITVMMVGCSKTALELPEPSVLYSAVESAAALSEMIELSSDELLDLTGIADDQYSAVAAYQTGLGMLPDEIVVLRAVDATNAADIETKLKDRLAYKKKSAEAYLTENLPTINAGVVRRDGLTVALIVTEDIASALKAYENAE
jgi:hypothetical protein